MTRISRIPRIAYDFAASALIGSFAYDSVQDYQPVLSATFGFMSGVFFFDGLNNALMFCFGDTHYKPFVLRDKKPMSNPNILDEHLTSRDNEDPAP